MDLNEQLQSLLDSGDEAGARKLVIEHFKQFPPEIQQRFAVDLFAEALDARTEATEAAVQLKQDIAEAITDIQGPSE